MGGIMDILTAPASAITNSLGLGGVNDVIGLLTGKTGIEMSQEMFNTSMDWEKEKLNKSIELLNTAHQRELEDLKKAGLNPIAFTGGNGAGSNVAGGSVSPLNMNGAGQGLRDMVFSGIGSVLDMQRQKKEIELLGQQITNLKTDNNYKQFKQMVEEFENMDWEMPDGQKVNKAQLLIGMLYNQLINQEQNNEKNEYDLHFLDKYGNAKEILNLIKLGTGSFKDVATGIADVIKSIKSPIMPTYNGEEQIQTIFDRNGKERVFKKTYRNRY